MDAEVFGGRRQSVPLANLSPEIAGLVEGAQQSVVEVRNGNRGAGAGVVQDASGLVLTNAHVVSGDRQGRKGRGGSRRRRQRSAPELTVAMQNGCQFEARLVKSDRALDLALLRLVANADGLPLNLPAARFGDSDALRAGEIVFAVGHPWGRLGAATAGVVGDRPYRGRPGAGVAYIRSDVALAPGNSGGPLLNAWGEVVGINAMIFDGAAISIPGNTVKTWLTESPTRTANRPAEVRLGVEVLAVVAGSEERSARSGLVVAGIRGGSPAEKIGLMVGDVLLSANEQTLHAPQDLLGVLADARTSSGESAETGTGRRARLEVRRGGHVSVFDVDLQARGPERAA